MALQLFCAHRTILIRQTSNDRIVAMIEILRPGDKSALHSFRAFLNNALTALYGAVHLMLVDVHPPGPCDPNGIHGSLVSAIRTEDYVLSREHPLTAAAYRGGAVVEAFVMHFGVGERIPQMPLFLTQENYIHVPLEAAYVAAWEDVPPRYQQVLVARPT
jgi:hypothetical protein